MNRFSGSTNPMSTGFRLAQGLTALTVVAIVVSSASAPAGADADGGVRGGVSQIADPPLTDTGTDPASGTHTDDPAEDGTTLPEIEELDQDLPEADLGVAGNQTIFAFSPAGCVGVTGKPHKSVVEAVVKGNTTCSVAVPGLAIRTTLHRSRWYGWQQMADSGMRTNSGVRAINTNVRKSCLNTTHDWQGRTYHESREPTGNYFAGTQNTQRFSC